MTAKELTPGMQLQTPRWGRCTVVSTQPAGKWLMIRVANRRGDIRALSKFPNSIVVTIHDEVHQP